MNIHSFYFNKRKTTLSIRKRYFSNDPKSILIFGDSNTWGFNPNHLDGSTFRIPFTRRWTTRLQDILGHDYNIIPCGLNARTSVFDDPISPCNGEYDCNGRHILPTILHSYKPLSVVIIALGTNDIKEKFRTSHHDVVNGIVTLVRDTQKLTDLGVHQRNEVKICPPKILVIGPPIIKVTPMSRIWGFPEDCEIKSKKISKLLEVTMANMSIEYLNIAKVAQVCDSDGIINTNLLITTSYFCIIFLF